MLSFQHQLAYEDCHRIEQHCYTQRRVLREEWSRAKAAILVQCKAACAEAMRQWYHRRALHVEREEQKALCSQLHHKVLLLSTNKTQALYLLLFAFLWQVKQLREDSQLRALEANREAELLLKRQLAASMKERDRERERREEISKELKVYHDVKSRQQEEEMLQHRRRVREQQCQLTKQAIKNSER